MVLAGITLGVAMLASTTERALILGDAAESDIMPKSEAQIIRAQELELT
jgi:hypothetical protein